MKITWDPKKDKLNRASKRIGLDLSWNMFDDPFVLIVYDRFENGEDRYHAIARVGSKFLLLVHSYPDSDDEDCVRAISLREATSRERKLYERREDETLGKGNPH